MTKLYQKLIRLCPSQNEINKGLRKLMEQTPEVPDKRLLMNILNSIDLTSLNIPTIKVTYSSYRQSKQLFRRFMNIPNVAAICVYQFRFGCKRKAYCQECENSLCCRRFPVPRPSEA